MIPTTCASWPRGSSTAPATKQVAQDCWNGLLKENSYASLKIFNIIDWIGDDTEPVPRGDARLQVRPRRLRQAHAGIHGRRGQRAEREAQEEITELFTARIQNSSRSSHRRLSPVSETDSLILQFLDLHHLRHELWRARRSPLAVARLLGLQALLHRADAVADERHMLEDPARRIPEILVEHDFTSLVEAQV